MRSAPLLLLLGAVAFAAPAFGHGSTDRSLQARVRALTTMHLARCWSEGQNAGGVVVVLAVRLASDGTLDGVPGVVAPMDHHRDPEAAAAVDAALQGAFGCAPYPYALDPVLADHPEYWRELELTFVAPR